MDLPLVSIIIPVYNAEQYVSKCIQSCLSQSYENIELILIDDGSTDGTNKICKEFASRDKRVHLFHVENGGPSLARNEGIKKATGKYLTFADSDDWMKKTAINKYVNVAEKNNASLVVSRFVRVIRQNKVNAKIPLGDITTSSVITRKDYVTRMSKAPADFYYGVLWNKFYRLDIIKSKFIFFPPKLNWCEDLVFNLDYLRYLSQDAIVATISDPLYYYLKRDGSICSSPNTYKKVLPLKVELFERYQKLYDSPSNVKSNKQSIQKLISQSKFLFSYAKDTGEVEFKKKQAEKKTNKKTVNTSSSNNKQKLIILQKKNTALRAELKQKNKEITQLANSIKKMTIEMNDLKKTTKRYKSLFSKVQKIIVDSKHISLH